MTNAAKGRISVTSVAVVWQAEPLSTAWLDALSALTDAEAKAFEVLQAYRVARDGLPGATLRALRTFGRRRAVRRLVARVSEPERADFRARRVMVDDLVGATRPVDPLSALCAALRDDAGLTDTEIVSVLGATRIELRGVSAEAARVRVRERIEREHRRSPRSA